VGRVAACCPVPTGDTLNGRVTFISHHEGQSSLTIKSIEKLDGRRYLIRLDGTPHLIKNSLLVKSVQSDSLVVEPPPVLAGHKQANFSVYRKAGDGKVHLLGPLLRISQSSVLDEWGTYMRTHSTVHVAGADALKPDGEIALSLLCTGEDRFIIPNVGFVQQ